MVVVVEVVGGAGGGDLLFNVLPHLLHLPGALRTSLLQQQLLLAAAAGCVLERVGAACTCECGMVGKLRSGCRAARARAER